MDPPAVVVLEKLAAFGAFDFRGLWKKRRRKLEWFIRKLRDKDYNKYRIMAVSD